jgi:hypothetical protein
MLNLELARIVTAERRRETAAAVRESSLRRALSERQAEAKAAALCPPSQPSSNAGRGVKPVLGSSR